MTLYSCYPSSLCCTLCVYVYVCFCVTLTETQVITLGLAFCIGVMREKFLTPGPLPRLLLHAPIPSSVYHKSHPHSVSTSTELQLCYSNRVWLSSFTEHTHLLQYATDTDS